MSRGGALPCCAENRFFVGLIAETSAVNYLFHMELNGCCGVLVPLTLGSQRARLSGDIVATVVVNTTSCLHVTWI